MMDEIEFELCLNIDPVVPAQPRPSLRKRRHSAVTTHERDGDGDEDEDEATLSTAVSVSKAQKHGNNNSNGNRNGNGNGQKRNNETQEHEQYLQLPPRKRVKGLSSFNHAVTDASITEQACPSEAGNTFTTEANNCYEDTSRTRTVQMAVDGDVGADIDADADIPMDQVMDTDAVEPIPPQTQTRESDIVSQRPQPPFVSFPEGAYMPAFLDSLTASTQASQQTRRSRTRFIIYEDPDPDLGPNQVLDGADDMEIDDAFPYPDLELQPSWGWFLSPEDDKENVDEYEQEQDNDHGHDRSGGDGREYGHQNEEHLNTFSEMRLGWGPGTGVYNYSARAGIEQRGFHNNTSNGTTYTSLVPYRAPLLPAPAPPREGGGQGDPDPQEGSSARPLSEIMRRFTHRDFLPLGIPPSAPDQTGFHTTTRETETAASETALTNPTYSSSSLIPLPTLSATELSHGFHALPPPVQNANTNSHSLSTSISTSTPTENPPSLPLRSRRPRSRLRRSIC